MIIQTQNGNYRPGDDDILDQGIEFSCNSIFIVGAETRASLKDATRTEDAIS